MINLTIKIHGANVPVVSGSERHGKISAAELKALRELDVSEWKADMLKIVESAFHRQQKKKQS